MRTSETHPLLIAELTPAPGCGSIGITFCPGKTQRHAASGAWARDLDLDLDAVAAWNAAAVVTLVEPHELNTLGVTTLGAAVAARHMAWYHLPILDQSIPDAAFEQAWRQSGEALRARLRSGFNILVHCKGGLGRAGTIAAKLAVELGRSPDEAVEATRAARPGAIENATQLAYVRRIEAISEHRPRIDGAAIHDRALGAIMGLAVGDAIGTTLEFKPRDSYPAITDMIGGGPFNLKPGQWTDDTSMALALLDSLLARGGLDETDLMERFVRWYETGEYSSTGKCFDIGITTRQALMRWKQTGNPIAGSTSPNTAGNGSLMRLAPVAIRYWNDRETLCEVAARQSATTHGAPEAVDACIAYAEILGDAIAGEPRSEVLRGRDANFSGLIAPIGAGSWRGKDRDDIRSSGYVAHSLEAALWCVGRTASFSEAVLLAANLGDDADTTAAITGQLAGALYGLDAIPCQWLEKLHGAENLIGLAGRLFDAGHTPNINI